MAPEYAPPQVDASGRARVILHVRVLRESEREAEREREGARWHTEFARSLPSQPPPPLHPIQTHTHARPQRQVYDVTNAPSGRVGDVTNKAVAAFNRVAKDALGLGGVFHGGVEVHGREWSFGLTEGRGVTGVYSVSPGANPMYQYREAVTLGECVCGEREGEREGEQGGIVGGQRRRVGAATNPPPLSHPSLSSLSPPLSSPSSSSPQARRPSPNPRWTPSSPACRPSGRDTATSCWGETASISARPSARPSGRARSRPG